MKRALTIVLGLVVVAALGAAGVWGTSMLLSGGGGGEEASGENGGGGGGEGGEGEGGGATRVGIARPETVTIEDDVRAVGTMRAVRVVDLVPASEGRVVEVPVASGKTVAAGDLLVRLDDRAERAALAEAEASLTEASQNFDRVSELEDENTVAEAQVEEARAARDRAAAAVGAASATLEDRTVTAPFDGTLGIVDVEPGAYLATDAPVTRLSDLSTVEVSAALPERYFDRVEDGQTVYVTTPAYPDDTFEGRLTVRASEIDLTSRSFEVRAEIDNSDGRLVGGMFADARLVLDTYEGLAVPDDAIISEGLTNFVYVVAEDDAAVRTDVEPGASLGDMTEVRGDLEPDARVVVAGWDQLSDGDTVEIDEDFDGEGLE